MSVCFDGIPAGSRVDEHLRLRRQRLQSYFDDPNSPVIFAAAHCRGADHREKVERALAEIDGLPAGLRYLEKLPYEPAAKDRELQPTDVPSSASGGLTQTPESSDVERAWSGLRDFEE